jgi:predicted nucleic acid-binding protein
LSFRNEVIEQAIEVRRAYHLKVPDAVIVASALALGLPLISADTSFQRIQPLTLTSDIV